MTEPQPTFNLVDRPWIPVRDLAGRSRLRSLRETFADAHALRGLDETSPLATVAVTRFLLAVLHRAIDGPADEHAWLELWSRRSLSMEGIDPYLARWRHRLDLFDPARPFMQVPSIAELVAPKDWKPVTALLVEASSGNNATLFDHSTDAAPPLYSGSEATRALLVRQAYSIGFGKSHPFYFRDGAMTRGYAVLAEGATLFETFMLNLQGYGPHAPPGLEWRRDQPDRPAWERDEWPAPVEEGTPPLGWTDLLTWQSRQIHLIPEPDGAGVRWCQIRQRYALPKDIIDPMKGYRQTKDGALVPIAFQPGRALWRDSTTLTARAEGRRPAVLEWVARLDDELRVAHGAPLGVAPVLVCGMTAADGKAASIAFWRAERLPLPLAYLGSDVLVGLLDQSLVEATRAERSLTFALKVFAREHLTLGERDAKREDLDAFIARLQADRNFWPHLDEAFQALLVALPEAVDDDVATAAALSTWRSAIVGRAVSTFDGAIAALGVSGRALRAAAIARRTLFGQLARNELLAVEHAGLPATIGEGVS